MGANQSLAALARAVGPAAAGLLFAGLHLAAAMVVAGGLTAVVGTALAVSATRTRGTSAAA